MYLAQIEITNFRQFGDPNPSFSLTLQEGVTALVGENDSGKTAVVDAIRHVLLTRDQDYMRLQPEDFHIKPDGHQATEITIRLKIAGLSKYDQASLIEYLVYEGAVPVLYIHWTARRLSDLPGSRRWVEVVVRSSPDGSGPTLDTAIRQLLATAYLRPLRDAEREMSSGRGSRLSQILSNFSSMQQGSGFDKASPPATAEQVNQLSLAGIADYLRHLVDQHPGVGTAQNEINSAYLAPLSLTGEHLKGKISFSEGGTEAARYRQILERLELELLEGSSGEARGKYGLGSNNLLFMACELLLLGKENEGLPLLLIEEPEAHLHPQRQLQLMEFLEVASKLSPAEENRPVQVIVTTHSANLASKIPLKNLVILQKQRPFSLAPLETELEKGDYKFLERFLDVTRSNLFFAKGLIIVEGAGESILLPTIAKILGRDLTKYGVSIVNVSGTGLRRYARIFQRKDVSKGVLSTRVACMADMDVMPDCAPQILEIVTDDTDPKWNNTRRKWKAKRDLGATPEEQATGLADRKVRLSASDSQGVKTFVADEWTLEYDLAFAGLHEEVFIAANLAANDDALNEEKKTQQEVEDQAKAELEPWRSLEKEELATRVFEPYASKRASKAIGAQYLAKLLSERFNNGQIDADGLKAVLPTYIYDAIHYVTEGPTPPATESPSSSS